jgi:alkanesulfonate monooxygenase SsuD/methylene tetrahydromethanopterin reductase-like flavin-dependent oxidoreductase (luciferase family)
VEYSIFSVQDHHPAFKRTIPELYDEVLEQGIMADKLGYNSFFVAEHHFHEYGAVPNPAIFLTVLAQHTKRIKLGPAISILTFHNPLTVAENYSMLDVLSKGRLVLGVGSGYLKHEFEGYNIDPEEKRERFDENLFVLKQVLSGQSVNFKGKYGSYNNVKTNVQVTQAQVPLFVAILRAEAAYHVGKQGNNIICVPYASLNEFPEIKDLYTDFKKGFAESGKQDPQALFAFHTHVAETDDLARKNAEEAFNLYVRTRLYAKQQNYDDVMQSGIHLFGSVETVANKIVELHHMGITHLMLLQNFGMLSPELVKNSMRLFIEKVKPFVEQKLRVSVS